MKQTLAVCKEANRKMEDTTDINTLTLNSFVFLLTCDSEESPYCFNYGKFLLIS